MPTLRSRLLRLAHHNPEFRKDLLPLLTAKVHPSEEARKKYLKEHPKADPKDHTVEEGKGDGGKGEEGKGQGKSVSEVKVGPGSLTREGKEAWESLDEPTRKQVEADIKSALEKHSDDPKAFVNALAKEADAWDRSNRDAGYAVFSIMREYEKALGVERD